MPAIHISEVQPGLVAYLDPAILVSLGGCLTNALPGPPDRAVTGKHPFLVLRLDDLQCLATPLFGDPQPDYWVLEERHKGGSLRGWKARPSHVSLFQHWKIPLTSIIAASINDLSVPGDRCTFAVTVPAVLERFSEWDWKYATSLYRTP